MQTTTQNMGNVLLNTLRLCHQTLELDPQNSQGQTDQLLYATFWFDWTGG